MMDSDYISHGFSFKKTGTTPECYSLESPLLKLSSVLDEALDTKLLQNSSFTTIVLDNIHKIHINNFFYIITS